MLIRKTTKQEADEVSAKTHWEIMLENRQETAFFSTFFKTLMFCIMNHHLYFCAQLLYIVRSLVHWVSCCSLVNDVYTC